MARDVACGRADLAGAAVLAGRGRDLRRLGRDHERAGDPGAHDVERERLLRRGADTRRQVGPDANRSAVDCDDAVSALKSTRGRPLAGDDRIDHWRDVIPDRPRDDESVGVTAGGNRHRCPLRQNRDGSMPRGDALLDVVPRADGLFVHGANRVAGLELREHRDRR